MFAEVWQQYGFRIATDHLVLFGFCADCLKVNLPTTKPVTGNGGGDREGY